eukprot:COSAG03_NODE_212_length_10585_cov_5.608812_12_plen_126_part_01
MLVLTTAEITHGGPRRTTTRTSQWYVLSVRVRVRSGGWGGGRSAVPTGCDLRFRSPVHTRTFIPPLSTRLGKVVIARKREFHSSYNTYKRRTLKVICLRMRFILGLDLGGWSVLINTCKNTGREGG